MSSTPQYTYVSSDSVLNTLNRERDFSNSASPAVTDDYNLNVVPTENYVPWFIDTDNMETNVGFETEPMSAFSTTYEDPEWDYQEAPSFPTSNAMYHNATDNSEPWSHTFPQQSFTSSPEEASTFTEGGEHTSFLPSSTQTNPSRRTFKQEPPTPSPSGSKPPSPKRRKSSTASTTSSPTEDYRKGHNAIEKRYRSNLNSKILSLEQCLPVLETPEDEEEGVGPAARKTKSAILTRAVQHIEFLKMNTRRLTLETEELNRKFSVLEKIALRSEVVEVADVDVDVEVDAEDEHELEETVGEVRETLSPETDVETAILNSKLLTRRRLKSGNS